MSAGRAGGRGFPAGWYGKIPTTGDFVARRVPGLFVGEWDRWASSALEGAQQRLGREWREHYLSMPVWRFLFSPGLIGARAWAGIMLPSVDAVGRYYPLVMVAALPSARLDVLATALRARTWFEQLEEAGLAALAPRSRSADIDARVAACRFREEWLFSLEAGATAPERVTRPRMVAIALDAGAASLSAAGALATGLAEPCAAWLAEPSEILGGSLLLGEALPSGEHFCAMMDGRWREHGWTVRETQAVS
jgi:type VI secretion system protein ImpM